MNFRWIPHSCTQTLFPCFGICDYFSFISLESAGGHTATKAMLQYCSEPFSVGYRSPGSMLTTRRQTHDEPCVQPASHDDPAHNPRLPTFRIRLLQSVYNDIVSTCDSLILEFRWVNISTYRILSGRAAALFVFPPLHCAQRLCLSSYSVALDYAETRPRSHERP